MDISDFLRFLFKMTMSKGQMAKELNLLRQYLSDLKSKLIPFSKEEMELLSLNQQDKSKKRGFEKIYKGIFNTIYYEPLIAYAIKIYSNGSKLILISSSEDEFAYLIKDGHTQVYMNDVEAGVLTPKGDFLNIRKQVIAKIDGADRLPTHAVWIQGKNIGFIFNPRFAEKTTPRAFSLLKDMNEDERSIFLCLTLVNLVEEAL